MLTSTIVFLAVAATPARIVDLTPTANRSAPVGCTFAGTIDDRAYFWVGLEGSPHRPREARTGRELWVSDGTAEGTHIVRDIDADPRSTMGGAPVGAVARSPDGFYFAHHHGPTGMEVWKTHPNGGGASLVAEIEPGPASKPLRSLAWTSRGLLAWSSDEFSVITNDGGVTTSTRAFTGRSNGRVAGGTLYSSGIDGACVATDGEVEFDYAPGQRCDVDETLVVGDRLVFTACDGFAICHLFGTEGPPETLTRFDELTDPELKRVSAQQAVVIAGPEDRRTIYRTDGRTVAAIATSTTAWIVDAALVDDELVALTADSIAVFEEGAWRALMPFEGYFVQTTAGEAYLQRPDPDDDTKADIVWTDGVTAEVVARDVYNTWYERAPVDGGFVTCAGPVDAASKGLWRVTRGGIEFVHDLWPARNDDTFVSAFVPNGDDVLVATASDTPAWHRIESSGDAVSSGVAMTDGPWVRHGRIVFLRGRDVFSAGGPDEDPVLVGTLSEAPRTIVPPGNAAPVFLLEGATPPFYTVVSDTLVELDADAIVDGRVLETSTFLAWTVGRGAVLHEPGGSTTVYETTGSSEPMFATAERAWFAERGSESRPPRLLGFDRGSRQLVVFPTEESSSRITKAAIENDRIYAVIRTSGPDDELWTATIDDGVGERVAKLRISDSREPALVVSWGRAYVIVDDPLFGREVWTSDGTSEGTHITTDVYPGRGTSLPTELTAVPGGVVFAAEDPTNGRELWFSDGTEEGTYLLADVAPGLAHGRPHRLTPANGRLYFAAWDPVAGFEPWSVELPEYPPLPVEESCGCTSSRPRRPPSWALMILAVVVLHRRARIFSGTR